jgi:ribonuclease-3
VPKRHDTALEDLSARLGYDFSNPKLLKLALTHSSVRAGKPTQEDNERLEFLGDRVLGLAVAELLAERFPKAREGELARWFSNLVSAATCAEIARNWKLDDLVRMNAGKPGTGIVGDACEAVLGAIFADAGYDAAKDVVRRFWEPQLCALELGGPTPKSVLQEWAQGRGLPLPRYVEVAKEGPEHAPHFTVEVQIDGVAPERGHGANKRTAEQAAALAMLLREGVQQAPIHDRS